MTFLDQAKTFVERVYRLPHQDDIEWECYEANWHLDNPELTHERLAEIIEDFLINHNTTFEELVKQQKEEMTEKRKASGLIYE